jgi:hypothetical protein
MKHIPEAGMFANFESTPSKMKNIPEAGMLGNFESGPSG